MVPPPAMGHQSQLSLVSADLAVCGALLLWEAVLML